jgi:hypothetical protein
MLRLSVVIAALVTIHLSAVAPQLKTAADLTKMGLASPAPFYGVYHTN